MILQARAIRILVLILFYNKNQKIQNINKYIH